MKKRRVLLTLLVLLLVVGIPVTLLARTIHQEQLNHALMVAVEYNNAEEALIALKAGANPNARGNQDEEPLTLRHQLQQLLDRLQHPPARREPNQSPTPLLVCSNMWTLSAHIDNPNLVKILLDAGADPNMAGEVEHISPLMLMADRNTIESFRILLAHGANVRQKDLYGRTPLHYAAERGNREIIQLLLDAGADMDAKDNDGDTPLHGACRRGDLEIVDFLLRLHAKVNVRGRDGDTALDNAYTEAIRQRMRQAGAKTWSELVLASH